MTENSLYEKLISISGPFCNKSQKRLYATFHHPNFTCLDGLRNTLKRMDFFKIPADLTGKIIFDFGCQAGSFCIEAAMRGAKKVIGFEYNQERVNLATDIAILCKLNHIISYECIDFLQYMNEDKLNAFIAKYGQCDILFCFALDGHIKNSFFYEFISKITKETIFLESNTKTFDEIGIMYAALIEDLGESDIGEILPQHRHGYIAHIGMYMRKKDFEQYSNRKYFYNEQIFYYILDKTFFEEQSQIFSRLKNPYFLSVTIHPFQRYSRKYVKGDYESVYNLMLKDELTKEDYCIIKKQVIDAMQQLKNQNIAHRDIQLLNILYSKEEKHIYIIDYEGMQNDFNPIEKGLDFIPVIKDRNRWCSIFQPNDRKNRFLSAIFPDLSINDFL